MLTPEAIRAHLDNLTKPPGSLGRLEDLAARLALIQQTLSPVTEPRSIVLFAADHGVVAEGVTAWPSSVTTLMVANMLAGGAASCVLARQTRTAMTIVDVGTAGEPESPRPGYVVAKVGRGTQNLYREAAMTVAEFEQAVAIGRAQAAGDFAVVAAGEMGIGNTTAAACLTALLTGTDPDDCVGRGAGADDAILQRKRHVVRVATERARGVSKGSPVAGIAEVCGYEIAAMAGFYMQAAEDGRTIVLDGSIAAAAAMVAQYLRPGTVEAMVAAHRSAEPGHTVALDALGLTPVLDGWEMRLGEGTGALLLMPLLDAAAAILTQMATFQNAGIGGP